MTELTLWSPHLGQGRAWLLVGVVTKADRVTSVLGFPLIGQGPAQLWWAPHFAADKVRMRALEPWPPAPPGSDLPRTNGPALLALFPAMPFPRALALADVSPAPLSDALRFILSSGQDRKDPSVE